MDKKKSNRFCNLSKVHGVPSLPIPTGKNPNTCPKVKTQWHMEWKPAAKMWFNMWAFLLSLILRLHSELLYIPWQNPHPSVPSTCLCPHCPIQAAFYHGLLLGSFKILKKSDSIFPPSPNMAALSEEKTSLRILWVSQFALGTWRPKFKDTKLVQYLSVQWATGHHVLQ